MRTRPVPATETDLVDTARNLHTYPSSTRVVILAISIISQIFKIIKTNLNESNFLSSFLQGANSYSILSAYIMCKKSKTTLKNKEHSRLSSIR